jgi:dephospho-CoA kinase
MASEPHQLNILKERCIALTGSIATGKSTLGKLIQDLGYEVIDADQLARLVVAPKTVGLKRIANQFGAKVLHADGSLNRSILREIVFNDKSARENLEKITHPLIRQALIAALQTKKDELVFYEASLIYEKNMQHNFLAVIATTCPLDIQISRLMKRDNIDKKQAEKIISSQMAASEKAKLADYAFDTSSPHGHVLKQLQSFLSNMKI